MLVATGTGVWVAAGAFVESALGEGKAAGSPPPQAAVARSSIAGATAREKNGTVRRLNGRLSWKIKVIQSIIPLRQARRPRAREMAVLVVWVSFEPAACSTYLPDSCGGKILPIHDIKSLSTSSLIEWPMLYS